VKHLVAAVCAVGALGLAACGSPAAGGVSGHAIEPVAASAVPKTLGELEVHAEDVKDTVAQAQNSYADQLSLYSLRKNNLVYATLEISRLTGKFDVKSDKQRALLADKIGGAKSEPHRIGPTVVYLTSGLRQRISVWFTGRHLFVLSTREDYDKPRTLLRDAVELKP
jgi:hypothetical protein